MRTRALTATTTALSITLAIATASLLAGCGHEQAQGPTGRELGAIRSSVNGLYFSPHLLQERASVLEVADALDTAALTGAQTPVRLSAADAGKLHDEAVTADPVVGRARLLSFTAAGDQRMLTPADATALAPFRRPDGSYRPGPQSGTDLPARVLATESALRVLSALQRISAGDRARTVGWLTGVARTAPDRTSVLLAMRALRRTGSPVPTVRVTPPVLQTLRSLSSYQQGLLVQDAALYAEAVGGAGLDRPSVEGLFTTNAGDCDFATLNQLVRLMRAVGATPAALKPAADRLAGVRLPDGTFRSDHDSLGSSMSTIYGQRLLRMRGETTRDPATAKAALAYAATPEVRTRPAELLLALGAAEIAGDKTRHGDLARLCTDPTLVPTRVTSGNVVGWYELSTVCTDAGLKPDAPAVTPWKGDSVEHLMGQALLVLGLDHQGRRKAVPSWIDGPALLDLVRQHTDDGALNQLAAPAAAYVIVSGGDDQVALDGLRVRAGRAKGCPGLPTFYRNEPTDASCDLRATVDTETFLSE